MSAPKKSQRNVREIFKEDEVLVKFKPSASAADHQKTHGKTGAKVLKKFNRLRMHHVKLKKGMTVDQAIKLYSKDPNVEYAEPDYVVSTDAVPNDTNYSSQWALHNTIYPGVDIDAPDAWSMTTGSNTIVIAVIDTGVDYNHPDLSANIWANNTELNGTTGLDDDANGYADDIHGIDTYNHDSNPGDDNYHGTHVAGIIGAIGNNSQGIAGVNWNVRIMPCKFIGAGGSGYTSGAIECLEYVKAKKDAGVNIVATNNSWGSANSYSQALSDAIDAQRDILFIAAAGNDGMDNNKYAFYPANYDLPNVISVASFNKYGAMSSFSDYGSRRVAVGAPGEDIYSTYAGNSYASLSGTSMAAPHVAGLAALLKAQNPSWDWRDIKNLILSGGVDMTAMNGKTITGKRVNAYGSMTCSNSPVFAVLDLPSNPVIGAANTLSALSINCNAPVGPVTVTLGGGGTIQLHDDGVAPDLAAGDGIFTGTWTPAYSGVETFVFTSPQGSKTAASPPVTISDQVSVDPPASFVATAVTSAPTGTAFNQTFSASGGIQPITWSVVSGSLPAGLTLNAATGEISGTPTAGGVYKITIQAADAIAMTDTKSWTIFVSKGLRTGWPKVLQTRVGHGYLSSSYSPIFADLNGDGKEEIIVADVNTLYVFDANGLVAKTVLSGTISTPVVADIDNDGQKEIIVGVGMYYSSTNSIYAFRSNLTLKPGFPAGSYQSYSGGPGEVKSVVAVDLDNDGKMELIAVCYANNANDPNYGKNVIVMVDYQGVAVPGWPKVVAGAYWGDYPPAVGDIDNDGSKEIVVATTDGYVHIYRKDGTEVRNWQFAQNPTEIWPPVLADMDGDGWLDVILKHNKNSSGQLTETIHVFDRTGAYLAGWPKSFTGMPPNGLAAADLDGDGRAEVIFVSGNYWNQLQALRSDGSPLPGWPVTINGGGTSIDTNPIVGDINGDGQMEVLINLYDYSKGTLAAYNVAGTLVAGYPKYTTPGNDIRSTPAIGDLDNNGRADIAVKSEDGMLYVWEEEQESAAATTAWPMFRHDPQHTGEHNIPSSGPDTMPYAFSFIDQTNVTLNTLVTSNTITVTGINAGAPMNITGGEYEINGNGIWSNASGTVMNTNTVRVRQTSSPSYGTRTDTILTIGGESDIFSVTTLVPDTTPDPFTFIDQTNASLNTLFTSNTITVNGINVPTSVTITSGEYEVNGNGIWSNASGTVVNTNTVRVRQTSSPSYGTRTDTILTIGGESDIFSVTTLVPDTTPDPFTFTDKTNAAVNTLYTSNSITVTGIAAPTPVTITGGQYQINNTGTWSSTSGTIVNNNKIRVRQTSSPDYGTRTDTVLTIGGVSDTYSVTTLVPDTTPNSFSFIDQTNASINALFTSNTITVKGINVPTSVTITGGEYEVNESGVWLSVNSTVVLNSTIRVRQTSSPDYGARTDTILTIGSVSDTFSVTTLVLDTTPDPFIFYDRTNVTTNTLITSNSVIITGINFPASVTVTGGQYSLNSSGIWSSASGTVVNNDTVRVRQTSSVNLGTRTDAILTVGGVSGSFSVTPQIAAQESLHGTITTLAGGGTAGDGIPAISASLDHPADVFVDAPGNVFIADDFNERIRKVSVIDAKISTVAGSGAYGFAGDGGPATSASFNNINGVFVDVIGNIFIADTYNHRIRRVNVSDGKINTVAGNGTAAFAGDGGPATSASLNYPVSVFVDSSGNIFIADEGNNCIRKVSASDGTISTVAGNGIDAYAGDGGPATSASISNPRHVYVDVSGNIFLADIGNHRIRKVNASDGKISTVAGNGTRGFAGDGGLATSASLNSPYSVFVDVIGNIFLADIGNHRIRRVNASDGKINTVAGNGTAAFAGDGGPATSASLYSPSGVFVDDAGNIFIADRGNDRIRKVIETTPPITTAYTTGYTTGYTFGTWTSAGLVSMNLSASDGSGIASGYPKYCIDTTNTCAPNISYSSTFNVTCAEGSTCAQYIRYQSMDNVGNIESVQNATVNQDLQLPVAIISASSATTTVNGPVNFTVTYSDVNFSSSSLAAADVTLNTTGTATGTVSVTGAGNTRTITIINITGSGTIGISLAAGTAVDFAGNAALGAGPSETFSVTTNIPLPPASSVTLSPSLTTPQVQGTQVTFTGQGEGGSGTYEYLFKIKSSTTTWSVVQLYSSDNTWTWDTTNIAPGIYTIQVRVRNAGTKVLYDALTNISYTINAPPVSDATLGAGLASPQTVGTKITFTGQGIGGSGSYEYMFKLKSSTTTWAVTQTYSTDNTWLWDTTGITPGTYTIQVRVRNAGSASAYDVLKNVSFTVK